MPLKMGMEKPIQSKKGSKPSDFSSWPVGTRPSLLRIPINPQDPTMTSPLNYQIDVSSALTTQVGGRNPKPMGTDPVELLRTLIEVQREALHLQKINLANQDHLHRWRAFLARWNGEFPDLGGQSKKSLPILERVYARMIQELHEKLADEEIVDNDFAMQDLLERFGVRLSQLGTLINLVTPLADATPNQDSTPQS